MESNRKRRGFMKGKLMPFYRATKLNSSTTTTVQYTSKVKPSQSSPSAASVGFSVHQDYVIAQPKPKVSFILPHESRDSVVQLDNLYGMAVDETVDSKAASYIYSVQERFKLERVNSERMIKCQDKC
ncbi:hypothetical protein PanWU01x14_146630 [Parasponia andersonii]|uniref:Uncharacterized protein n=1 Tax=Parasponia andersonii TaxID=3476 RepID=A0A2P5CJW1_PARAD|nr:hypothetical protein PanWU01x14_146630 [Parasponia andersonii]